MAKGQYRKATVRIFPDRSMLAKDIARIFKITEEKIQEGTNKGIEEYLEMLKDHAIANHPWKSRSETLERSHKVFKTDKGWALKANPIDAGADYDYGGLLEFGKERGLVNYSQNYAWIRPAHEMMKWKLNAFVLKNILK